MSNIPQVLCAVKAVIMEGEKSLLVKQVVGDKVFWDLPGGRVNFGESPYDTLHREVKEETSLEVDIVRPIGMWWFFREKDGNQVVCNTFLCKLKKGSIDLSKNVAEESISEFRWVTKSEFLSGDYAVYESLKRLVQENIP